MTTKLMLLMTVAALAMAACGTSAAKTEFRQHAERITEIRAGGSSEDGINLLTSSLKISEDDYLLMGCDNSCATRNFPDVAREEREEGRWFAGGDDLKDRFYNAHLTERTDGTWAVEAFYTTLPREPYRASAEEVAWHYVRVKQLRAEGMPVEQRIATMNAEAKGRPWLNMR